MSLPLSKLGRRYGYKKDTPDHRDLGLVTMWPIAQKAPPPGMPTPPVDLEEWCGPVRDQGDLGSCTAHAGVGMREFLFRKYHDFETKRSELAPEQAIFSPLYLYYRERYIEGTLPGDDGAQMRSIVKALRGFGACLETEDNYRAYNFNLPPTPDQTAHAYLYHAGAYHRISDVSSMKSCLASGYVFALGMNVFESFESDEVAANGLMPMPATGEKCVGGHAVLCIGYDDDVQCPGAKPGALKLRNSWGAEWGAKGNFWMPYDFAANRDYVTDCWIAHLGGGW